MRTPLVAGILVCAGVLAAGVVVPFARQEPPGVVLRVDQRHPAATDAGQGTADRPFLTIQAAADRALDLRRSGSAVTVLIAPGLYREHVELRESAVDPGAPSLVIEGSGPGLVVVSGAEPWTGWSAVPGSGLYRSRWPYARGFAPIPRGWDDVRDDVERKPVMLRGEMVMAEGRVLRQVLTREAVDATPDSYYVEDASAAGEGAIWLHPRPGLDPTRASVEVSVRPAVLVAHRIGNLVLRNLVVRQAASHLQDAALQLNGCTNVVVERVEASWNNWNGIGLFDVDGVTLRRVAANHNGAGGVGSFRARKLVIEDTEASFNNWRGDWSEFRGWAVGQKFFHVHDARFTRFRAVGNRTTGLWFDTDARDVVLEQLVIEDNQTRGLFLEALQGPVLLRDSSIRRNREIGLFATAVGNLTLERNVIADNGAHQIYVPWLADHHVVRPETDYETGDVIPIRTEGWTMVENTIGGEAGTLLFSVGMWNRFFRSLRSDRNRWYLDGETKAFGVYVRIHAEPWRMDLTEWQRVSRQDANSVFRPEAPPAPSPGSAAGAR